MKRTNTIVPSIIASDQKELSAQLKKVGKHTKTLHLDIMDGTFVKNKSLWFDFKIPKGIYEAHLMTTKPEMFVGKHIGEIQTFMIHPETANNVDDLLELIHSQKKKLFLVLSPNKTVASIKKYLKEIDGVLIMTVQPGQYGAPFLPKMLAKIKELRTINKNIVIAVDGSMNPKTIAQAKKNGASHFSVGSYIQKSKNIAKTIKELQNA